MGFLDSAQTLLSGVLSLARTRLRVLGSISTEVLHTATVPVLRGAPDQP